MLKCVFTGVPLAEVYGLEERADAELAEMLAGLAAGTSRGRAVDARRRAGTARPDWEG